VKNILLKIIPVLLCFFWFTNDSNGGEPFVYQLQKVVIDAGHGGKDPGCSGPHSKEKGIALNIALKLGSYINENIPGVEVVYTRKKDVFVELDERASIANKAKADLFISIHCNAQSGGTTAQGTETFVMGLHKNDDNLHVAKRENSVILMEDNYEEDYKDYKGFDSSDPIASHIALTQYQNAYLEQSVLFANMVEKQFKERARRRSRGVKQAGLVVLFKTDMPSVLIESGFLTHRTEESYLLSDDGQSYIASAIYRAFKEYKTIMENNGGNVPTSQNIAKANSSARETSKTNSDQEIKLVSQTVTESKVKYRVQLYSSYDNVDFSKVSFRQDVSIEIETNDSGVKYYLLIDEFDQLLDANRLMEKFKRDGFSKAKIIKYQGLDRVD